MTRKILSIYPNCSLGGMTTVYKNRVTANNSDIFDFIFINDNGGYSVFNNFKNGAIRIVRKDRIDAYIKYLSKTFSYDEVRVTSLPEVYQNINPNFSATLIYEFHTSDLNIITKEISRLNLSVIDEIWVPSNYLKDMVASLLPLESLPKLKVVPNLVDAEIFTPEGPLLEIQDMNPTSKPILWLGRLDKGKNYKDFFRTLNLLPKEYFGLVILSLEDDPGRMAEALYEATSFGIADRVRFFLNMAQVDIAKLYRFATARKGYFCSTSLAESFGYAVIEAAMTGIPVIAYDVGALREHLYHPFGMQFVDAGDVYQLADWIKTADWEGMHIDNLMARNFYLQDKIL